MVNLLVFIRRIYHIWPNYSAKLRLCVHVQDVSWRLQPDNHIKTRRPVIEVLWDWVGGAN